MNASTYVASPEHLGVPTVGLEIAKTIQSEEQMITEHENELSYEQTIGQVVVGGATGALGSSVGMLILKGVEAITTIEHPVPDKILIPSLILGGTVSGAINHVRRRRQTAEEIAKF